MRTRVGWIQNRIAGNIARRGTMVTFRWTETSGGTVNAVTKEIIGGTRINQNLSIRVLLHWPDYMEIQQKGWEEIKKGDLILDVAPGLLPGMGNDWWVDVDGQAYTPKAVGAQQKAALDQSFGGQGLLRTLVLRPGR